VVTSGRAGGLAAVRWRRLGLGGGSSHPSGRAVRTRVSCGARGLNQGNGRPDRLGGHDCRRARPRAHPAPIGGASLGQRGCHPAGVVGVGVVLTDTSIATDALTTSSWRSEPAGQVVHPRSPSSLEKYLRITSALDCSMSSRGARSVSRLRVLLGDRPGVRHVTRGRLRASRILASTLAESIRVDGCCRWQPGGWPAGPFSAAQPHKT
jgi:hypothetical protein